MKTQNTYSIKGFTDSVTDCDCCGKTELKGTFIMIDENGNDFYFGSVCGAKAIGITTKMLSITVKEINLNAELEQLAKNATYEYAKHKVLKFVEKKKLNVLEFVKKYGEVLEDAKFYTCYVYGAKTFMDWKQ